MKSYIALIGILLLCGRAVLPCNAQQYFNKRYTLNSNACIISSCLQSNDYYYSTALSLDSINYDASSGGFLNKWGVHFSVYDNTGQILIDSFYQRGDRRLIDPWSNNLIRLPDATFLLAANAADTGLKYGHYAAYNALLQFDSIGNVLMYKEYEYPYCTTWDAPIYNVMDFKPDTYGNWLMLSSMVCNGKVSFSLRKLDAAFEEIWVKKISVRDTLDSTPKHLLIENDGYVLTGALDNGNIKPYKANYYSSVIVKTDTAGNVQWRWQNTFDTLHLQYTVNDIIRSSDGGYVYCGTGEGEPYYWSGSKEWAGILTKGWVEKLDASRNSVWKRMIGTVKGSPTSAQQTVLRELPNGDILVAGMIGERFDSLDETNAWIRASLTRLRGADGSIVWQRTYKSPDGNDTMYLSIYDMRPTDDGGYILAGEAKNAIDRGMGPIQRGWLLKVDSNACASDVPCWPAAIQEPIVLSPAFQVYPNPSSGIFTISSLRGTTQSVIATNASPSIRIYDFTGRVVYQSDVHFVGSEAQVQLDAAAGIYILELSDKATGVLYRQRLELK